MKDTNAPLDEAVLQTFTETLSTDDRIDRVVLVAGKDTDEHKHLAVTLDPTRYPEHIERARIERLFGPKPNSFFYLITH